MAEQDQEQNKTEDATPYKLKRAREKGQVARGQDLGFVGSLIAFAVFVLWFGSAFVGRLTDLMRASFTVGIERAGQTGEVLATVRSIYWLAFQPLVILGGIIAVVLITLEIMQLRGFIFTTEPLKPQFSRLNPIKGLKKFFSMRLLKEALKNIVKMIIYTGIAWLMITSAIEMFGDTFGDANALVRAMDGASKRMLFAFVCAAIAFMFIDQIISRGEFAKQMRMSRRELTREAKEREGEPRFKKKRREIHAEMRAQSEGLANLDGSDFLITNPTHYAVGLRYNPGEMSEPIVTAKGRNNFAQLLKRKARLLAIPVIADPVLARGLYKDCRQGKPISSQHFHAVARHYRHKLDREERERRSKQQSEHMKQEQQVPEEAVKEVERADG